MKINKLMIIGLLSMITCSTFVSAKAHDHHTLIKGSKPTKKSLYLVQSKWKNKDNKLIKLDSLKGKPVVITMLYTNCKNSCPLIMAHLKFLEQQLKQNKNKVNFVIVSLDPKRDTPEVLKEFATKFKADTKNWFFLNGNNDNVLELSALLGIRFKKTDNDEIMHTNKITLLNQTGEILFQTENISSQQDKVISNINKLLI